MNDRKQLQTLLATIIPYLPQPVVQEHLADPQTGRVKGEYWQGSVLFADLSGFTALSEKLNAMGKEAGEAITAIVNDLFGALLKDVERYGGILLKFGGDALTVFFGGDRHALYAAQTGLDLQKTMAQRFVNIDTRWGTFTLRVRIGVHTGQIFAAQVGHEPGAPLRGMELVVTGADINRVATAQDFASPGEVCITAETLVQIITQAEVEPVSESLYRLKSLNPLVELEAMPPPALWYPHADDSLLLLRQYLEALRPFLPVDLEDERIIDPSDPKLRPGLRPVAVLFANFADFSAILAALAGKGQAGVNAAIHILNTFYARMQDIIGRYGGVVNKVDIYTRGDKLMALFGAPIAHGDDAERAVRAALEMQAAMSKVNDYIHKTLKDVGVPPISLTLRIGINYGHVFAGNIGSDRAGSRREYTVMGDAVNLAARLMSAAEEGGVLSSPSVHRRVMDTFVLRDLPPIQVKGKAKQIAICQPLRPLNESERADQRAGQRQLIGRKPQLELLNEALQAVIGPDVGQGQVVAVMGEVGAGKTHLIKAFERDLNESRHKQPLACYATELPSFAAETPYLPIIDLLRRMTGLTDDAQQDVERLTRWVWTHKADLIRFLPLLGDLMGLPIPDNQVTAALSLEQRRDRLFGLIESLWYNLARRQPLILLIDGLQWADESSLALLNHLSKTVNRAPVLLVFTLRPNTPLTTPWLDLPHCRQLNLLEFSEQESDMLIAYLLETDHVPPKLASTIYQRAQGNPLFTQQVVKSLMETQSLVRDNGIWRITLDAEMLPIPDTIEGIVLARLDRLGARCRRVLQEAAVAVRFSQPLLDKVHTATQELVECLAMLVDKDLLHKEKKPASDSPDLQDLEHTLLDPEYSFRQAITREVAYDNLLYARRRELHLLIGQAMEIIYHDRLDEYAASLARHYREAEVWKLTFHYYRRAGRRAQSLFANQAAADYFQSALNIAQQHMQASLLDIVDVQTNLGDVSRMQGHYDQALMAYNQALDQASGHAPAETLAELYHKIATIHESKGDYRTAFEWVERGLRVQSGQQTVQVARLSYFATALSLRQGNIQAGMQSCQQSLTIAQAIQAQSEIARAYSMYCLLYRNMGDLPKALDSGNQSLEIYQSLQDPVGMARAHNNVGLVYIEQDKWDQASEHYWEGLQFSEAIGDRDATARFSLNLGEILQFQGDLPGAFKAYKRSLDIWSEIGYLGGIAVACSGLGEVAMMQGDLQASQDYLARSQALFEQMGAQSKLTEVYRRQAALLLAQGKPGKALTAAQRAYELAKEIKTRVQQGQAMRVLGSIFLALDRLTEAQHYLEASLEIFVELKSTCKFAKACYVLASVYLEQAGREGEGLVLLEQSGHLLADLGAAWDLARVKAAIAAAQD